jgi:hypothetical protein
MTDYTIVLAAIAGALASIAIALLYVVQALRLVVAAICKHGAPNPTEQAWESEPVSQPGNPLPTGLYHPDADDMTGYLNDKIEQTRKDRRDPYAPADWNEVMGRGE